MGSSFRNNAQALSDGQTLYEAFNCVRLPRPRRRRHGAAADGQQVVLRQRAAAGLSVDRRGPAQRHALVPRPDSGLPGLGVGRVRAQPERPGQSQCRRGREDHMSAQPPPNSMPKETPVTVPEPTTGPATDGWRDDAGDDRRQPVTRRSRPAHA